MKVVSVNVGLPRDVEWNGKTVRTGIFKEPVEGHITMKTLNLEGDGQADLTVHGGRDMAVYAYPTAHYDYWKQTFPELDFPYAVFGENLTIDGLSEETVHVGGRFRVGNAEVAVTQPRLPCSKLGMRFGRQDIIKTFLQSRRTGFYFRVLNEGEVGAGDRVELIEKNETAVTIADIVNLYAFDKDNVKLLERAAQTDALPSSWRDLFRKHLEQIQS